MHVVATVRKHPWEPQRAALGLVIAFAMLITACQSTPSTPPLATLTGTESGTIAFESRSAYDFVNMIDGSAPVVTVSGVLSVPEGASAQAPVPAVIISHGSGGVNDKLGGRYAPALEEIGMASLIIDSYRPRGVSGTIRDQSRVTSQMMAADAFAGLRLLASDPRIDGDRIAILGFSKGGIVALYSAFERIRGWYATGDERFAAHAPFYPYCGVIPDDLTLTGAPVTMFLGGADNYTPASQCTHLQSVADPDETVLQDILYPGAHHGFDSSSPVRNANNYNPSKCNFTVDNNGVTRVAETGTSASSRSERKAALQACGRFGVNIGGHPTANSQSMEDLKAFLLKTLAAPTS